MTHKIQLPVVNIDGLVKNANHCSAIVKKVNIILDYKTIKIKETIMGEFDQGELFVRVKNSSGEEFICPLKALRNPKELTAEELEHRRPEPFTG